MRKQHNKQGTMVGTMTVQHTCPNTNYAEQFHVKENVSCENRCAPWAGRLDTMSRNPFMYDRDAGRCREESSEFGFGPGMFPDPRIDFSEGGSKSMIPIADPDSDAQLLELAMIKRTDVANPADVPSPYVAGNTDRYGAAPPLVREAKPPTCAPRPRYARTRMQREW